MTNLNVQTNRHGPQNKGCHHASADIKQASPSIPIDQSETHSHQEFLNLHYVPVAKSFIDQVHISIKGDTGYDVPFITGKSLIKLHFRLEENLNKRPMGHNAHLS